MIDQKYYVIKEDLMFFGRTKVFNLKSSKGRIFKKTEALVSFFVEEIGDGEAFSRIVEIPVKDFSYKARKMIKLNWKNINDVFHKAYTNDNVEVASIEKDMYLTDITSGRRFKIFNLCQGMEMAQDLYNNANETKHFKNIIANEQFHQV